jgi:hypothetical protein
MVRLFFYPPVSSLPVWLCVSAMHHNAKIQKSPVFSPPKFDPFSIDNNIYVMV